MDVPALQALSHNRRADVRAAVCAVETAVIPVPSVHYRALAEIPLRIVVEQVLAASGRTLLAVGGGYLSGYTDEIRQRLAHEGIGVLPRDDRAVLTLILLFSVAIPRASGTALPEQLWTQGTPVPRDQLKGCQASDVVLTSALQRLTHADLVRRTRTGYVLGHQFLRLTPAVGAELFEQLILLADPDSALAESIRRRRARPTVPTATALDHEVHDRS
ncbi:hypothetical protein H3L99_00100 [Streptomyces pristinaespiralis]|uniref:Uncharacterized protein n=1 Tax=Streptomyces pristinaespiralis TaxID=38300 RepID=A0A0M4DCN7_STRPR|nr:hypothetical protein [Streptomyces pristinaespiralis]ALC18330.1 hypothetical protein SPRI_0024 [Streptomyces pristinaespiralis]ALC25635.1 hypothetical protein SPRI_7329 [Streptomyces pristinaespiralis]QMU12191.1 hypothetical protein H3L99_00100 [Streptomyces pristinaespiralis]